MSTGTFILLMLLGLFVCLITGLMTSDCRHEIVPYIFVILAVVCVLSAIIFPVLTTRNDFERAEEPYVTHEIMCLNDSSMMSGRFYLRSGYIDEDLHYLYGYKTSSGGMKTQKVNDNISTVYFDDTIEPCAKWYTETQRFWFLTNTRYSCDIYVPTNSLAAGYTIDLQ